MDGTFPQQYYQAQFDIIADFNQWTPEERAWDPAASLQDDTVGRLDFDSLVRALPQRYGRPRQRDVSPVTEQSLLGLEEGVGATETTLRRDLEAAQKERAPQ